MYRLSAVNASQLSFANGRIVIPRTPNPITASGVVMTSSSVLPYNNPDAAKQAIQTIALIPRNPPVCNREAISKAVVGLLHKAPPLEPGDGEQTPHRSR